MEAVGFQWSEALRQESSQINVFCFWLMFAKSCCHLGDWTVSDRRTDDCLRSSAQVEQSPSVGERTQ